jgi:hypothetical protein
MNHGPRGGTLLAPTLVVRGGMRAAETERLVLDLGSGGISGVRGHGISTSNFPSCRLPFGSSDWRTRVVFALLNPVLSSDKA